MNIFFHSTTDTLSSYIVRLHFRSPTANIIIDGISSTILSYTAYTRDSDFDTITPIEMFNAILYHFANITL